MIDKQDGFYKEKFFVAKHCYIREALRNIRDSGNIDLHNRILYFLNSLNNDNEYLVINQDEPYAEEVYNIIRDNSQKQIIAFIGRAGSGKDYQSQLLVKKGFKKLAFADKLREVTCKMFGFDYKHVINHYDDFKSNKVTNNLTGRQALENVGATIRSLNENTWVNEVIKEIQQNNYKRVCISDMRYPNEYTALRTFAEDNGYEFKAIYCNYQSDRYEYDNPHESAALSNWLSQYYDDLEEIKYNSIDEYLNKYNSL